MLDENHHFTFMPGRRKYLFCGDKQGLKKMQPLIEKVSKYNVPFEMCEVDSAELASWLSRQKMGSYLYVSVSWNRLRELMVLAEDIGFTEEEAQYIGHGERIVSIFCCRCHGLTPVPVSAHSIHCSHCQLMLTISDHYSSLRNAYLGYAAKI